MSAETTERWHQGVCGVLHPEAHPYLVEIAQYPELIGKLWESDRYMAGFVVGERMFYVYPGTEHVPPIFEVCTKEDQRIHSEYVNPQDFRKVFGKILDEFTRERLSTDTLAAMLGADMLRIVAQYLTGDVVFMPGEAEGILSEARAVMGGEQ